ncbi:MAG: DUF4244 domain-containing protein [Acidimicrobiales bacterium]
MSLEFRATRRCVSPLPFVASRHDRGQATAEYALVILGAAAIALLVIGWASSTSAVSDLLDRVVRAVADRVA